MWLLGIWFCGELGSAALVVGLNNLGGLFQTQGFCDSVILWFYDSVTWGNT